MRDIKELMEKYEEIWFVVPEGYRERFAKNLTELKFRWIGRPFRKPIKPEKLAEAPYIGITSKNRTLGYVRGMCWAASFNGNGVLDQNDNVVDLVHVDYGKFYDGNEDFLITDVKCPDCWKNGHARIFR